MLSRHLVSSARQARARTLLSMAFALAAMVIVAACGESSESSAGSDGKFRFSDTATFNDAEPKAPSVEGKELSTLGEVPEPEGGVKVGVLLKTLTNQYWQQVEAGLKAASDEFGVETGPIQAASSENAQQEQLQICQTLLQQDFDALIVAPETTSNLNPCLNQAKSRNIPLINIAAPGPGVPATVYVGPALLTEGRQSVDYLAEELQPGSQVAHISGLPGSSAADLRVEGYREGIANSELESVAVVTGDWDEQTAYDRAQDLLSRFSRLAGIYAANDTMAGAVSRAAQQAKRSELLIVGTDGVPQAISDIRSGNLSATATPFPYCQGFWALEAAARVLGGQKVPLWIETSDTIITQENVDEFFEADGTANAGVCG
jgi:ribose transport system substrate-binding protein